MDVLVNFTMITTLRYMQISDFHVVHLKLTQNYLPITTNNAEKKNPKTMKHLEESIGKKFGNLG